MKRGRSTGAPTKAHQERFDAIKEIGCVVARLRGLGFVPCEIHHLTVGGKHGQKRLGHDSTVGLNHWSHRGVRDQWGLDSTAEYEDTFGPSYARNPRAFRALYSDDLLLAEQNRLIEEWQQGKL